MSSHLNVILEDKSNLYSILYKKLIIFQKVNKKKSNYT